MHFWQSGHVARIFVIKKIKVMAIIKNNDLIEGISGKYGNHVFKQVRGKTIVCPLPPKPRSESEQQKENRNRFKQASAWAKRILLDADQKAYYLKKACKLNLPNAYTAAIADYMRRAKVMQVSQYADRTTFSIRKKDFAVAQIDLVLHTDSGEKETRTLPKGESFFWLHTRQLHAGVVVMVTDAAGVTREHRLLAA
jgi:hypothetical protein